jgi:hypothetical protein
MDEKRQSARPSTALRKILPEAAEIDAAEDEQFGEHRGDELPPELATSQGRRDSLREASAASTIMLPPFTRVSIGRRCRPARSTRAAVDATLPGST